MDRKARYPFKWFGLLTRMSVLLTMTLGTATLRASPIDDERQPEPSDPSAYYDEPADKPAALNAILTMPDANEDSFDLPDGEHCHNTQHEDNSMQRRWDIEKPGQLQLMPTPLPSWDVVRYVNSAALPTFRTGDGFGPQVTVKK